MPVEKYGVLRGRPVDVFIDAPTDPSPHYHVQIKAGTSFYEASINVQSRVEPGNPDLSALLYVDVSPFTHPLINRLDGLLAGFTPLPRTNQRTDPRALDYVRDGLFDALQMKKLPAFQPGAKNDLCDLLDARVRRVIQDQGELFVFGSQWLHQGITNHHFAQSFRPDSGAHDVHMNQGSDRSFPKYAATDGVGQDGGLLFRSAEQPARWEAIFLKFQTQCWRTDDQTGASLC